MSKDGEKAYLAYRISLLDSCIEKLRERRKKLLHEQRTLYTEERLHLGTLSSETQKTQSP